MKNLLITLFFLFISVFAFSQLTVYTSTTNPSCFGANNGVAQVDSVTGGTDPYTYTWNNGATTQVINNLTTGIYIVTTVDFSSFTSIDTIYLNDGPQLSLTFSAINSKCFETYDGTASVTVTGGTAPYNYNWNNGSVLQTATGLLTGSHIVTVQDINACSQIDSVNVYTSDFWGESFNITNESCIGNDGAVDLVYNGGTTPFTFQWDNGPTTEDISGVTQGTYTVTMVDANNCNSIQTAYVSASNLSISVSSINGLCYNSSDGQASVYGINGGVSPYSFLWNDGQVTQTANNLNSIGETWYYVTVTDVNSCMGIDSLPIYYTGPWFESLNLQAQNESCLGNDGSISFSLGGGGVTPFSYQWSNGATSNSLSNLQASNYSLTLFDANGCQVSNSIDVYSYTPVTSPWIVQASGFTAPRTIEKFSIVNDSVAFGMTLDGFISKTTNGGNTWSEVQITGINQDHYFADLFALDANTIFTLFADQAVGGGFLMVSLDGGSTWNIDSSIYNGATSWPNSIHFFDNANGVMMGDAENGYMEIYTTNNSGTSWTRVNSGNIPAWDGTEYGTVRKHSPFGNTIWFSTTTGRVFKSTDMGLTWSVSDVFGGETIDEIAFMNDSIGIAKTPSWNRMVTNDGGATWSYLNQTGNLYFKFTSTGDGQYLVSYAQGQNGTGGGVSYSKDGLNWIEKDNQLGTYSLSLKNKDLGWAATQNAVSCGGIRKIVTGAFDISECGAYLTYTRSNISCLGMNDGAISSIGIAGQGTPYTYLWEDGSTVDNKSGLVSGDYILTVTSNYCYQIDTLKILDVPLGGENWIEQTPNLSSTKQIIKFSIVDSSIAWAFTKTNANGAGVILKTIDGGNTWEEGQVSGVSVDHYFSDFCAIDANVAYALFANTSIGGGLFTKTTDGGITWTVDSSLYISSSSFPAAVYFFDSNNGVSFGDPESGYFEIYTTSDGGANWSRVLSSNIPAPDTAAAEYTYTDKYAVIGNSIWIPTNRGRVLKSVDMGLNWSVHDVSIGQDLGQISFKDELNGIVLSPQSSYLAITNDGGVTWNNFNPTTGEVHIQLTSTNDPNGGYFVSYNSNYGASYSEDGLNWLPIDSAGHSAMDFKGNNLAWAGTNAANNCFGIRKLDPSFFTPIQTPSAITITSSTSNVLCAGGSTGSVSITVIGGVSPYTYNWSNGAVTNSINNLVAGNYIVTVTDANGNAAENDTVIISQPTPVSISIVNQNNVSCFMKNDGSATVTGAGGVGNFTYMWSNGKVAQTLTGLIAKTYTVVAIDSNSCQSNPDTVIITQPANLVVSSFASNSNCGQNDGSISVATIGGVSPYTYSWQNGNTTNNLANIISGGYRLTVTDNLGCKASRYVMVGDNDGPSVSIISVTPANCGGQDGKVYSSVSGGQQPYQYIWSNGVTKPHLFNAYSGEVDLVVVDNNGCSGTAQTTVSSNGTNPPSISGHVTTQISGFNVNSGKVSILIPNPYGGQFIKVGETNLDVNGFYSFDAVAPIGEYTLKIFADTSIPAYANTIPTYYNLTNRWDSAKVINTVCDSAFIQNLVVRELMPLNGVNNLNGLVSNDGTNKANGGRAGDPIPGVDIALEQIPGGIIANTETDINGKFKFNNVPVSDSSYTIYVDIPGLEMVNSYQVDFSKVVGLDSTVSNLNFLVSDTTIYTDVVISFDNEMFSNSKEDILFSYPNPFSNQTTISYIVAKQSDVLFEVYNVIGDKLYEYATINAKEGVYNVRLDSDTFGYSGGVYIVKLKVGDTTQSIRLIKSN